MMLELVGILLLNFIKVGRMYGSGFEIGIRVANSFDDVGNISDSGLSGFRVEFAADTFLTGSTILLASA